VISYSLFLAAGAVTLTVINGGTNAGTQLWFDRKNGMFEQLLMGPFTALSTSLSIIFATLIIGVAGSLLVFGFAFPVLGASFAPTWEGALLIAGALFLGTDVLWRVRHRSVRRLEVVRDVPDRVDIRFFIFLFTSSVFFPASSAPSAIQVASLRQPVDVHDRHLPCGLFNAVTPTVSLELGILAIEPQ